MKIKRFFNTISKIFTGKSLFTVLIVPSLLQILIVTFFTGYLAFSNSNQAINKLAFQLCDEIAENLSQHLLDYLNESKAIQKIFFAELKKSNLSLDSLAELEALFLKQIEGFDSINKIYFSGERKKHFIGVVKENQSLQLWIVDLSSDFPIKRKFYKLDSNGNRLKLLKIQDYDPHSRPWYKLARDFKKPIFSDVYKFAAVSFSGFPTSGITKSVPIFDSKKELQGVLAFDITLSQINSFIRGSQVSQNGIVFILDEKGDLIASSLQRNLKDFHNLKDKQDRVLNNESSLISQSIKYLSKNNRTIKSFKSFSTSFETLDGSKHFLHVKPLKNNYELNWQIVVVIPRSDFTAQIDANTINTIWFCLLFLFLAIIIGIFTARRTIQPILMLNEYAKNFTKDITNARWDDKQSNLKRSDEVGELFRSFNKMAQQLKYLVFTLEERVKQRSKQLEQAQEAKVEAVKQSEKILANFLEAVPVGVFVIDKKGKPYYANKASNFILGKGLVEVNPVKLIETYRLFKAGTNELYPNHLNPILIALKEGKSLTIEDMEVQNGSKKTLLQVFANPIFNTEKKVEYAIVVFFDITKRKETETERLKFIQELEIKNLQLQEYVEKIESLSLKNALQEALLKNITKDPDRFEYQLGGTLLASAPTYVVREADVILYKSLINGQFCYLFNARQMGKSSMQVRIAAQLQNEGYRCISLDLSQFVSETMTTEIFYSTLTYHTSKKIKLSSFNIKTWNKNLEFLSPLERFGEFLREIVLKQVKQNIVIFIDEIDAILKAKSVSNSFFPFIRSLYNQRTNISEYKRLTFCLLGRTTPSDLIEDKENTPFNIGIPIPLTGFTKDEVKKSFLKKGIENKCKNLDRVIDEVLKWTGGQPFLTQKVCNFIKKDLEFISESKESSIIETLVREQFIDSWQEKDEPHHLKTIQNIFIKNKTNPILLIETYAKILDNGCIKNQGFWEHEQLLISGIVRSYKNKLIVYNLIYKEVFNYEWIKDTLEMLLK